jgi:NAD(P)-dependent dehydrogenase (short-subunit alcohol dehydrogenase family)
MAIVCVTGASSGIGRALRTRLEAKGDMVIAVDKDPGGPGSVTADLRTPDGRHEAVEAVASAVVATAGLHGALDGLATCAGLDQTFDGPSILSTNYFGTVEVIDGLRPLLARSDRASVVAVSSNAATVAPGVPANVVAACLDGDEAAARDHTDGRTAYMASKLAVARWVRRRAADYAADGIRLNAVEPGATDSPMMRRIVDSDPRVAELMEHLAIPAGRWGEPDELAAVMAFLLSTDASYVYGAVWNVDGGAQAAVRADDWPVAWAGPDA